MSNKVISVSDADFDSAVLQSGEPVLVGFWADWCNPCKRIAVILEDLADIYSTHLKIAQVNIDHNRVLAGRYHVCSVPMIMVFKGGEIWAARSGVVGKSQLTELINRTLEGTIT